MWVIWTLILVSSLLLVIGFTRAGIAVFWDTREDAAEDEAVEAQSRLALVSVFGLFGVIVLITVFAQPVTAFLADTAQQIHDPRSYIGAVLKVRGEQAP